MVEEELTCGVHLRCLGGGGVLEVSACLRFFWVGAVTASSSETISVFRFDLRLVAFFDFLCDFFGGLYASVQQRASECVLGVCSVACVHGALCHTVALLLGVFGRGVTVVARG